MQQLNLFYYIKRRQCALLYKPTAKIRYHFTKYQQSSTFSHHFVLHSILFSPKMTSKMNTILIVGATSGIGEQFARRFHGLGKKVIVTGRRADRLSALENELSGIEIRQVCFPTDTSEHDSSSHAEKLDQMLTGVTLIIVGCYRLRSAPQLCLLYPKSTPNTRYGFHQCGDTKLFLAARNFEYQRREHCLRSQLKPHSSDSPNTTLCASPHLPCCKRPHN